MPSNNAKLKRKYQMTNSKIEFYSYVAMAALMIVSIIGLGFASFVK